MFEESNLYVNNDYPIHNFYMTENQYYLMSLSSRRLNDLQIMIEYISREHDARFEVVPLRYAGDNGAMIGWAGILRYKFAGGHDISETNIKPKERMDQISIPWRSQ